MNKVIKFLCLNALLIGSASLAMDVNNNNNNQDLERTIKEEVLCNAALEGKLWLIQELLDEGVSANAKNKNTTALRCAIIGGNNNICSELIANGANRHAVNGGETPLQKAARMAWNDSRLEICYQIIDALLEPIYNQKAAIALLGMKKFRNVTYLKPLDKNVIQLIAHLIYKPVPIAKELLNLFNQIDTIENQDTKEKLLAYIQKQLAPKTIQSDSKCTIA